MDAFTEFAAAVAGRFGDRVRWWITQNEPWIIALLGYRLGLHAPGIRDLRSSVAASHHILLATDAPSQARCRRSWSPCVEWFARKLAHGTGADAIHGAVPTARVGAALSLFPCDPASDDTADRAAASGSDGYVNRWYLDPLLGKDYPTDMWEHYERAIGGGLEEIIGSGDTELIGGRSDFLGVNYYSRRVVAAAQPRPFPWRVTGPSGDAARTDLGDEVAPDSLRELLLRLHRDYPGVPLMITENGAAYGDTPTHDGLVHDQRRIEFLLAHLRAGGEAIERGAPVAGYLHWSLLDNFEWAFGYRPGSAWCTSTTRPAAGPSRIPGGCTRGSRAPAGCPSRSRP